MQLDCHDFNIEINYPTLNRFGVYYTPTNASVTYTLTFKETPPVTNINITAKLSLENYDFSITEIYIYQAMPRTLFFEIPYEVGFEEPLTVKLEVTASYFGVSENITVAEITEMVAYPKYSAVTFFNPNDFNVGILKAFCNFGTDYLTSTGHVYCTWEKSSDGIHYSPIKFASEVSPVYYKDLYTNTEISEQFSPNTSLDEVYVAKPAYHLMGRSEHDALSLRSDVLMLDSSFFKNSIFKFSVFTLKHIDEVQLPTFPGDEDLVTCYSGKDLDLGYKEYFPVIAPNTELAYIDLPNSSSGKLFYSNNTAFSYGTPEHKNNIIASNVGEITSPISRLIDLPSKDGGTVTTMVAWRDHIIAATASELFLISKYDNAFTTKVISTFTGVPAEDSKCVCTTFNGIIFKARSKIYLLYPNVYSETDSVLNLTEISSPVESFIETYEAQSKILPFAFSTDKEYFLMMPDEHTCSTSCLKYNFQNKTWVRHTYPVLFTEICVKNNDTISLYGVYNTDTLSVYTIEEDLSDEDISDGDAENTQYGDILLEKSTATPISFNIDSGQKTDSVNMPKQFVESKFNLATLHNKDCFPMQVTVHVDGTPHVTTVDVNTDAAFWKASEADRLVLSTTATSDKTKLFNVFRQMFTRYSGRGKSVRHIIEGKSNYPFKLYDIEYRYKNLNIKH